MMMMITNTGRSVARNFQLFCFNLRLPTIPTTPASSTRYSGFADIDGFPSPFSGDLFGIGFDPSSQHLLLQPSQLPTPVHGQLLLTPHHLLSSTSSSASAAAAVLHPPEVGGRAATRSSSQLTAAVAAFAEPPSQTSTTLDGGTIDQATEDEVSSSCVGVTSGARQQTASSADRQSRGIGATGSRQKMTLDANDAEDDMEIAA